MSSTTKELSEALRKFMSMAPEKLGAAKPTTMHECTALQLARQSRGPLTQQETPNEAGETVTISGYFTPDLEAMRMIYERMEGKPAVSADVSSGSNNSRHYLNDMESARLDRMTPEERVQDAQHQAEYEIALEEWKKTPIERQPGESLDKYVNRCMVEELNFMGKWQSQNHRTDDGAAPVDESEPQQSNTPQESPADEAIRKANEGYARRILAGPPKESPVAVPQEQQLLIPQPYVPPVEPEYDGLGRLILPETLQTPSHSLRSPTDPPKRHRVHRTGTDYPNRA